MMRGGRLATTRLLPILGTKEMGLSSVTRTSPQAGPGAQLGAGIVFGVAAWLAAPALRAAEPGTIAVVAPSGVAVALDPAALAKLPAVQDRIAFKSEHGPTDALFTGPLLWTALIDAHAIDPAKPKDAAREAIIITGADGYGAVVALGEIAPAFENKQVLLATRMNGKALTPGHLRIVVPDDQHGGRSVRDVVRIALIRL